MVSGLKEFFTTPVDNNKKRFLILLVAVAFLFTPQHPPVDWDLNTTNFWADIPNTYTNNPNFVYPPWGLILMIPYRLMQAGGARILSVLVIGWLVVQQNWSLSKFLFIVFSPYFLWTMIMSSMDVFVFVLPVLLWKAVTGTRWQAPGWGLALSILLLKPQGAVFVWPYLIWTTRKSWQDLIFPLAIVALITLPISLVGSPPLILQWMDNITNPSQQNQVYWSINNISMHSRFTLPGALLILLAVSLLFLLLVKRKMVVWSANHTLTAMLLVSMFLSPYASQQGVSSALAFVPSWHAYLVLILGFILAASLNVFSDYHYLFALLFALVSLIFFAPRSKTRADSTYLRTQ